MNIRRTFNVASNYHTCKCVALTAKMKPVAIGPERADNDLQMALFAFGTEKGNTKQTCTFVLYQRQQTHAHESELQWPRLTE